jgi:glycosyltransferase involved in cell wall biosynthesis
MLETPLVSVGMPIFNCERTLDVAVRSILQQTYETWQLLLVDDGSTDRTVQIARAFKDARIQVISDGSHRGLSARLNQAISLSAGEYFARMDGDDVSYPQRFERQLRYLQEHPEVDLLGAGILVFKAEGQALGTRTVWERHNDICRRPWAGFYLPHPTWMGKTAWFKQHLYRPQAVRMEDQDLMLRTYQTSQFASLPEILVGYREDAFCLRKALSGRLHFVKLLAGDSLISRSSRFITGRGVAEHLLKALIEVLAVKTGTTYRILRHRALPATEKELAQWQQVWSALTTSGSAEAASQLNPATASLI